MLLTRGNPSGGRPLQQGSFPLHEDKSGNFGLLIGYLPDGEKLLLPMPLADEIACKFAFSLEEFRDRMGITKPKEKLRHKLIKLLGGNLNLDN